MPSKRDQYGRKVPKQNRRKHTRVLSQLHGRRKTVKHRNKDEKTTDNSWIKKQLERLEKMEEKLDEKT